MFVLLYRLPFDTPATAKRERRSVLGTNFLLAAVLGAQVMAFGVVPVLLVQGSIIALASIVGVWLFSVQHRFEEAQWAHQDTWNPVQASLEGSSYLKLPRVPNHRLQERHQAQPELGQVTTLTLRGSGATIHVTLAVGGLAITLPG